MFIFHLSYPVDLCFLVFFVTEYQAKKDYYTLLYTKAKVGHIADEDRKAKLREYRNAGKEDRNSTGAVPSPDGSFHRPRKLLAHSLCPGLRNRVRGKVIVFSV